MDTFLLDADEKSLGATLARMTSCDGLTFVVFTKSDDLRKALGALGFANLPRSPTTVQHGYRAWQKNPPIRGVRNRPTKAERRKVHTDI